METMYGLQVGQLDMVALAMDVAKRIDCRFQVTQPKEGWRYEVARERPNKAQTILCALERSGVLWTEIIIGHEPLPENKEYESNMSISEGTKSSEVLPILGAAAIIVSLVAFVAVSALIAICQGIDPVVILVMPDGRWLEILRYEEPL